METCRAFHHQTQLYPPLKAEKGRDGIIMGIIGVEIMLKIIIITQRIIMIMIMMIIMIV